MNLRPQVDSLCLKQNRPNTELPSASSQRDVQPVPLAQSALTEPETRHPPWSPHWSPCPADRALQLLGRLPKGPALRELLTGSATWARPHPSVTSQESNVSEPHPSPTTHLPTVVCVTESRPGHCAHASAPSEAHFRAPRDSWRPCGTQAGWSFTQELPFQSNLASHMPHSTAPGHGAPPPARNPGPVLPQGVPLDHQ